MVQSNLELAVFMQNPGTGMNWSQVYVGNQFRHLMVMPQENLRITMADQPWDDCDDPDLMRELLGFDDRFPYSEPSMSAPEYVGRRKHATGI